MSGKSSRNPWTLSAKGGRGDDTSVFAPIETRSPERDADGEEAAPVCVNCERNVADSSTPCDNCGEVDLCKACMPRCSFCGYQMCGVCIESGRYSDCNWVEVVKRKSDGKEFKICIGSCDCCFDKPEHKDAYQREGDSEPADSDASSEERSDSESEGKKRKAAKRELADLLS